MAVLDLEIRVADRCIAEVAVQSRQPQPAALLVGCTPEQALAVLGRLYTICGHAQRAAAAFALAAATGIPLAPRRCAELVAAVGREAVQEHLWRLLLDWPRALGLPADRARFAHWHRRLGTGGAFAPELLAELERDWLGSPAAALAELAAAGRHDAWAEAGAAPAARLFGALRTAASSRTAEAVGADVGAAAPGRPGGSRGALGRPLAPASRAASPLADHAWPRALQRADRLLEARVAARATALVELLVSLAQRGADDALELDAESPGASRGRAAVGTARGMLVHDVTLAPGDGAGVARIAACTIATPTERHFAAEGEFVAAVRGRPVADAAAARRWAELWVLVLDPCVPWELRVAAPEAASPEVGVHA